MLFFQDHQLLFLDVIVGRLQNGLERDETDNLRACDGHVKLFGVLACLLVGRVNGRDIVIRQVERYLSDLSLFQPPTDALDSLETARFFGTSALFTQIQSDTMRLLFRAEYVDVESNQKFSDTRRCGAPTWNEFRWTEIRLPFFLDYLVHRSRVQHNNLFMTSYTHV